MSGIVANKRSDTEVLLELLQDPAAVSDRLAEIKKAEDRAQVVIDLAGPSNEILQLREQIAQQAAEQEEMLKDCDAECVQRAQNADADAKAIIEAAQQQADGVRDQAERILGEANQKATEASQRLQVSADATVETDNLRAELLAKISGVTLQSETFTQREQQLLKEKARIEDLVEYIRLALE